MILTGKAEVDFIKWASYNYGEDSGDLAMMREVYRNALIIEFFDSVGIYIDIRIEFNDSFVLKTFDSYAEDDYVGNYSNRQEATIQAIEKANDIYNEKNNLI